MRLRASSLLLGTALALSAGGESPGCRALTGAGIGAAGGNPGAGALAGGAAGAAVGGLTSPDQVYAGRAPCD